MRETASGPLVATLAGDALSASMAHVDYPPSLFVMRGNVVDECVGLDALKPTPLPSVLTREK